MKWSEFEEKNHVGIVEKCCANCKHGDPGWEGECSCDHPELDDDWDEGRYSTSIHFVCDLWERRSNGKV